MGKTELALRGNGLTMRFLLALVSIIIVEELINQCLVEMLKG